MDISRLMTHAQHIEEKIKNKEKENKSAKPVVLTFLGKNQILVITIYFVKNL